MLNREKISLFHIEKKFLDNNKINIILNDVSCEFEQGKCYAIVGASGVGKSTLMHLLAGIDTPTAGDVLWDNRSLFSLVPEERVKVVSLVTQSSFLIKELNVFENLLVAGMTYGLPKGRALADALGFLNAVGLSDAKEWHIGQLSGGQRQRLSLARALMAKPLFLLADEPTGNLDEATAHELLDLLSSCQKKWNMGLVISTHSTYVMQKMDVVFTLKNGMLVNVL